MHFRKNRAFSKVKAELHFQMQVFHIDDVLGGDLVASTQQTIEELIMAAKKKAKKVAKKKAAKKKKKK